MMRILLGLTLALGLIFNANARQLEGAEIAEQLTLNGQELTLNGAGVRSKFFLDVYVAALYLGNKSNDAAAIIAADEPMAIRLHIVSGMINSK
ncbi:MAG: chalcone isomerase family protein, partial [Gammaproteobacteria bacterium]|nr:chalcone isomerase family protein [Gammaproteobacteria bacterium]